MRHVIIIGAQRSGTTLLYGMLDDHPDIRMSRPVRPEPKYFLNEIEGKDYEDYRQKVFPNTSGNFKYLGEKSTSYYERPEVAKRIHRLISDVKIIVQLRNPIDRALSNYDFSHENGLEKRTLEEVFIKHTHPPEKKFDTSVDPFDYLGRGEYVRHLKPYLELFSDRMLILDIEEVITGRENERICSFLEVKKHVFHVDLLSFRNEVPRTQPSEEVQNKLRDYFRPFNHHLQEHTGFDVTSWNQGK